MTVEYAPDGLIGVLTPQANTTVEPELWIMLPPGVAMINARMTSDRSSLEARLVDYFDQIEKTVEQFHNAPVGAFAFATTGASYLAGIPREREVVETIGQRMGVPLITAGRAVVLALETIGAKRIGIVSPYPEGLTKASIAYWQEHGFVVDGVVQIATRSDEFHPIYSIPAANARQGLDQLESKRLDAIVMLGTGMPTLEPILERPQVGGAPVMSCMLCLGWASIDAGLCSVPILKFASYRGNLLCELRNQRDTSNVMILVRFGFEVPMTDSGRATDRNFKSTALVEAGILCESICHGLPV
jgi:maleate cis-trans isomerase